MEKDTNKEVAQQAKSKRDETLARLQQRHPDTPFDDDEAMYGQINDDYDDYDSQIGGYKEREEKLSNMFSSDPRSAYFLTKWRDGGDPVVALIEQFGKDDLIDAINDPERLEEIAAANREYVAKIAKEKELNEQYRQNLQESLPQLEQFRDEHGMSDDDFDQLMDKLLNIVNDALLGKFAPETLEMLYKGENYDADVADADAEGEVRGKNARIEEKLRKSSRGDGVAALDGKNGSVAPRPRRETGALGKFGEGYKNIWERGGEKRTKVRE